jgi:hypothetical protein
MAFNFNTFGTELRYEMHSKNYITGAMSIAFWMKVASLPGNNVIIAYKQPGEFLTEVYKVYVQTSGNGMGLYLRWTGIQQDASVILQPSLNTWHHYALVRASNNQVSSYFNGTLQVNQTGGGGAPTAAHTDDHRMAVGPSGGLLAKVAVWSTALNVLQVSSLAGGTSPLQVAGGNVRFYSSFLGAYIPPRQKVQWRAAA